MGFTCGPCCTELQCGDNVKCVPLLLCVLASVEVYSGETCCSTLKTTLAWSCIGLGVEGEYPPMYQYVGGVLSCSEFSLNIVGTVYENEEGTCCVKFIMTDSESEYIFESCDGTFAAGTSIEIQGGDYVLGVNVTPVNGDTNEAAFSDADGNCPECGPIALVKGAVVGSVTPCPNRTQGDQVAESLGVLPGQLCRFAEPCQCLPGTAVCVRYFVNGKCAAQEFAWLGGCDCNGCDGASFEVTGPYNLPEERDIFISKIDGSCGLLLRVVGETFEFSEVISLGRLVHDDMPTWETWTKVCNFLYPRTEVFQQDNGAPGGHTEEIQITLDCECLPATSEDCPGGCGQLAQVVGAVEDPCPLPSVMASVVDSTCDFDGFSFELCSNLPENSANCPGFNQQQFAVVEGSADICQSYISNNPDFAIAPGAPDVIANETTIVFPGCETYGLAFGEEPVPSLYGDFILYYDPTACPDSPPRPELYKLAYGFVSICGDGVSVISESLNGVAEPIVASCNPFRLDFEVPIPVAGDCACCEEDTMILRITL